MVKGLTVYIEKPYQLVFKEEKIDPILDHEMRCSTILSTISPGTEVSAYKGLPHLRPGVKYPRLVGYLNVAKIEEVGSKIREYNVGDIILSFTSHRSHFKISEKEQIIKLPYLENYSEVSLTYIYHLGYKAILSANPSQDQKICVIGLGVIGLAAVNMAKMLGYEVDCISDHDETLQIADKLGAKKCFSRKNFLKDEYEIVINTSNSWKDWKISLEIIKFLGTISCIGFPGRESPPGEFNPLDSAYFYAKNLKIISNCYAHQDEEKKNMLYILEKIFKKKLLPSILISDVRPSKDIEEIYKLLLKKSNNEITFSLKW